MKKRIVPALLCLLLALNLSACGGTANPGNGSDISKFDAAAYVDGLIKENYLGEFDESYLELVGITEEEARKTYESGLALDVDYFLYIYDIGRPTDETRKEIERLFQEIYTHVKYEVVSAARQDDGSYAVKVEVEPIDIIQLAEADWDKTMKEFYETYPTQRLNTMTDSEYEAVEREWTRLILDLYWGKLEEIGNQTPRAITLQLELDEDGCYSVNRDDFTRLDEAILNWTGGGESL